MPEKRTGRPIEGKQSLPQKKENPNFIIIRDKGIADAFGFMHNEALATTQKQIYWPDKNGYEIRVYSPKYNCSVQLGADEYEPVECEVVEAVAEFANSLGFNAVDLTENVRKNFC